MFGSFTDPDGLGLWTYALQAAAGALTDSAQLALNDTAYNNAYIQAVAKASDFQSALIQCSGTTRARWARTSQLH